jgi:hypothetical protein
VKVPELTPAEVRRYALDFCREQMKLMLAAFPELRPEPEVRVVRRRARRAGTRENPQQPRPGWSDRPDVQDKLDRIGALLGVGPQ